MTELFAPAEYWQCPHRHIYCNGCGTKGLGGWIVPDTLYGLSIEECCNIHDWMYSHGKTIEDKESADRSFLNNMLRVIEDSRSMGLIRWFRRSRAMSYYSAVKDFGGPAFWSGKNKPEELKEV